MPRHTGTRQVESVLCSEKEAEQHVYLQQLLRWLKKNNKKKPLIRVFFQVACLWTQSADLCLCFRWTRACRRAWCQVWSWRCACARSPTALTGWLTSSPHVASCCCFGTRDTRMTVAPTSGATSWRQTSTRWAGAASMARPWGHQRVRRGCLLMNRMGFFLAEGIQYHSFE